MEKKELRKSMKEILSKLDPVSKAFESCGRCVSFIQSQYFKSAKVIFGFMPMNDELDVLPVLREALNQEKIVLLPRIISGTNKMNFFYIDKDINAETEKGEFGIYEPSSSCRKADISQICTEYSGCEISVLVPGLAFGKDNSRLGRGKSFYDSFLSELALKCNEKPVFCGVCYKAQIVDSVPVEKHDVKMDFLIQNI